MYSLFKLHIIISTPFEAYDTTNMSQFALISGESVFGGLPVVLSTGSFSPSPINFTESVVGIAWAAGSMGKMFMYRVTHLDSKSLLLT